MIRGHATSGGTAAYAARFANVQYNLLGTTGLQCSAAGFGGYRIAAGVADHEKALRYALSQGINLIDTSSNYSDGESERLIGQVLKSLVEDAALKREQVIVISKVGYIQGSNYTLSRERKAEGRGFADLVEYSEGLEHCIHPDFLDDQLTRSLQRLNLETLDAFLLHNPEYYLGWAAKHGMDRPTAQTEFYHRIRKAFAFLETAVAEGRIKAYGISANTFVSPSDHAEFVSLERICKIAGEIADEGKRGHHFALVQFPMNLLEAGAVLEQNQEGGRSVLDVALEHGLGCLINRPLNAFGPDGLLRLAEVAGTDRYADDDITTAIGHLNRSEKRLWRKLLPALNLPLPLYNRIKEQVGVADQLKHYWRNFGSYERWRQIRDGMFLPRVQGVIQYCDQHRAAVEELGEWGDHHAQLLEAALKAVGSLYVGQARRRIKELGDRILAADPDWASARTLSQKAVRAVRSTAGVGCVLVGMRRQAYVRDILEELARPVNQTGRRDAWAALTRL